MSERGITVETGGADLAGFLLDSGQVKRALEAMKGGMRAVNASIAASARGLARMGAGAKGVLAALMDTRTVTDGLRAGMKNLYAYSKTWWQSFSGTLNGLAANAQYLKNSLAAMAAPLLNALSPAIDLVTEKFVALFNVINQVFARLTGASTYVVAKKNAAAWGQVAKNAGNAGDEVKRCLMGFDELNVLTAGASGHGGGGGGGGGGGAGLMFEELAIDGGLAAFVDALKAAFEAGDWQTLGTLIGGKINEMVESVDWAAIGAKVGHYVNGLFSTAYWTLETVNFTNLGAGVAECLNSALAKIDFATAGGAVALLFTSLAETIAGFVDEFDWTRFAEKLADGLNGFVGKLGEKLDGIDWAALALRLTEGLNTFIARADWALAGQTFAGRVNDLLAILGTAAANFDWKGAGAALAEGVNGLLRRVDWDGLGDWLNDTLQGVLDYALAFVEGFDAGAFADGLSRALGKVDWDGIAAKLWALLSAALKKLGQSAGALFFGGSTDMSVNLSLLKKGWSTISAWLGIESPLLALIALAKSGWSSIAGFVGTGVTVGTTLSKVNWSSISAYVGTAVTAGVKLAKDGWHSIEGFVGTRVAAGVSLNKDGWKSLEGFVGKSVNVAVKASLDSKSAQQLKSAATKALKGIKVSVKASGSGGNVKMTTQATGGAITDGGRRIAFARGGVIAGGLARYLAKAPHYASGTASAHGTVFVAGEAGPEIMGHINGRTEILNKSQIASAIYAAVVDGMGRAVSALGTFLANRMADCANAIVATLGNVGGLSGVAGLEFHAPAMASGGVLPYDVAAQIARTGADIQGTLNANNEDLIQTIISVAGQLVAAVGRIPAAGAPESGLTARQIVGQINRQTLMFGASPLK